MERNFMIAFFVLALTAGLALGFSVNNAVLTGQASRLTHGDSDGGFDPFEFGECKDRFGMSSIDYCSGNFVHEFAFIGGECLEVIYDCTAYDTICIKGECSLGYIGQHSWYD